MIAQIGFERFNFKKLSTTINSTEASVYRYFKNKHQLLDYLIAWYWSWLNHSIEIEITNIADPHDRLDAALRVITRKKEIDENFPGFNIPALQQILICEAAFYHFFNQHIETPMEIPVNGYVAICLKLAGLIHEINPSFLFPMSLIHTAMEAANQQSFLFSRNQRLIEFPFTENLFEQNYTFIKMMVFNTIKP